MEESVSKREADNFIDEVEATISKYPQATFPLVHTFTPGLYSRCITMEAGSFLTSKVHKTEHQFCVLEGVIDVINGADNSVVRLETGHHGITPAGTRRILYAHETTRWITFHSTLKQTPEEVEEDIIEKYYNPLLTLPQEEQKCHTLQSEQ